jgi:hypothetical protein
MTSERRFRQIARLERLAQPYFELGKQARAIWTDVRRRAAANAAGLAFVIHYGRPVMGEPLEEAFNRVAASDAWKKLGSKFPEVRHDDRFDVHVHLDDTRGDILRHGVIANFPGDDERQKLNFVFASAPAWLIYFTFGDYTAKLLGLTVPDLSDVSGFKRPREHFERWPNLPRGVFELVPLEKGFRNQLFTDKNLTSSVVSSEQERMTGRERKRELLIQKRHPAEKSDDEWPFLWDKWFLDKTSSQVMSLLNTRLPT